MSAAPYLFYRYPFCHRPVQYRRGCPKRRLGADFSQNETRTYTVCRPASQIRFSLYRMTGTPQIWSPRALSGDDSRINSRPQPLSMIVGIGYTGWGLLQREPTQSSGVPGGVPPWRLFPIFIARRKRMSAHRALPVRMRLPMRRHTQSGAHAAGYSSFLSPRKRKKRRGSPPEPPGNLGDTSTRPGCLN